MPSTSERIAVIVNPGIPQQPADGIPNVLQQAFHKAVRLLPGPGVCHYHIGK